MNDLKSLVASVKAAYVLSDFVKSSGVRLTTAGAGKWKGLCPFHQEKTPSFTISDHFQNYHCFGCGAHGDLLTFAMAHSALSFFETLRQLAEDKGIKVEVSDHEDSSVDYAALRQCLRESANFFVKNYRKLPPDHPARLQVTSRGLSEKKMLYGYAPEKRDSLYRHLKGLGFKEETMVQAGVVSFWEETKTYSDFWSGRLMFFITDISGKPIGFSGRKLFEDDKRGKFVNSQAGPLFDKSSAFFNIQNAKVPASREKTLYVAEGQFDVAAFIEADVPQVVASSGTAFTPRQGSIAQRLVGESGSIVFAFDGDAAGIQAALKVFKHVPSIHSNSWVVQFPLGEDPCDFRLAQGNEKFRELLELRVPLVEFVLEATKRDFELDKELGRAAYLEKAASIVKTIASPSLRDTYIRRVALDTFTEMDTLRRLVARAKPLEEDEVSGELTNPTVTLGDTPQETVTLLEKLEKDEVYALAARCLALVFVDPSLKKFLKGRENRFPPEFQGLLREIQAKDIATKVIPEEFEESDLVSYLINPELFPMAGNPLFKPREQFVYVYKVYKDTLKRRAELPREKQIFETLKGAPETQQLDLLRRALENQE